MILLYQIIFSFLKRKPCSVKLQEDIYTKIVFQSSLFYSCVTNTQLFKLRLFKLL